MIMVMMMLLVETGILMVVVVFRRFSVVTLIVAMFDGHFDNSVVYGYIFFLGEKEKNI